MKKAFHNFKLYILGIALAIFGIGLPLGIYGITMIPSLNVDPFQYPFLMVALAFLYALIGFAVSDIQIARWRRKNAEYDTKLPQEVKDKAWSIRFPFYLAVSIMLIVILFFEVWFWVAKDYPFPVNM